MGHTPGPWSCDDYGVDYEGARFGEVAFVLSKDGVSFDAIDANARLIAAAPDLLEVCQRILERGYVSPSIAEERVDHDALAAAIARATGAGA